MTLTVHQSHLFNANFHEIARLRNGLSGDADICPKNSEILQQLPRKLAVQLPAALSMPCQDQDVNACAIQIQL